MELFKKKGKKSVEELKKELALAEIEAKKNADPVAKVFNAEISTGKEIKVESKDSSQITLDQVILQNTDLWYKTQVLNLLISINEKLDGVDVK